MAMSTAPKAAFRLHFCNSNTLHTYCSFSKPFICDSNNYEVDCYCKSANLNAALRAVLITTFAIWPLQGLLQKGKRCMEYAPTTKQATKQKKGSNQNDTNRYR